MGTAVLQAPPAVRKRGQFRSTHDHLRVWCEPNPQLISRESHVLPNHYSSFLRSYMKLGPEDVKNGLPPPSVKLKVNVHAYS
jgi:hypothetical protein